MTFTPVEEEYWIKSQRKQMAYEEPVGLTGSKRGGAIGRLPTVFPLNIVVLEETRQLDDSAVGRPSTKLLATSLQTTRRVAARKFS